MANPKQEQFNSESAKWQTRYSLATDNQDKMFKRFAKWYDLMYAAINTKDYAPWRSKVYLPILASKAWAMLSKLQALSPGFEVGLYEENQDDPEAQEKANKAQWKLEYDWDNPDFDESMEEKLFSPLVDALVTGTGFAKVPWCTSENKTYSRPSLVDGYVDPTMEQIDTTKTGYNDLEPVNIFNLFMAPGARNLYSAPWIIIKEFKTISDLRDSGMYDSKTLDSVKLMQSKTDQFAQEKKSRNRLTSDQDPVASDTTIQQVEVYECYEKSTNRIITFVSGNSGGSNNNESQWVQIRSVKNPYWHGKYPLVAFYSRKRPYDFWGQGIFEDTERMQQGAIDVFNHFVDSYNLSVNGMIMKQQGEEFSYVVGPGQELEYRNNPPQQFKFSDPNPAVMQQVITTIEQAIEEATISPYSSGTPNSKSDQTAGTATGIMRLQQAAGDKIAATKKSYSHALKMIGKMWLSNNKQFTTVPTVVRGMQNNQPTPVTVTPEDLQKRVVLRINDASMEPLSPEDRLAKMQATTQQLLSLQQASMAQAQSGAPTKPLVIDFTSLAQDLLQQSGQANFEKIILGEEELQQMQQEQQAEQMPGEMQQDVVQSPMNPEADTEVATDVQQMAQQGHVAPEVAQSLAPHLPIQGGISGQQQGAPAVTNGPGAGQQDQAPGGSSVMGVLRRLVGR